MRLTETPDLRVGIYFRAILTGSVSVQEKPRAPAVPLVKSRKQNQPRVLGKSLPLAFRPLGKHHTEQSRAGSSSGTKGEIFPSPESRPSAATEQRTVPFLPPPAALGQPLRPASYSPLPGLHRHSTSLQLSAKPSRSPQGSALACKATVPRVTRELGVRWVLEVCCLPLPRGLKH